MDPHPQQGVLVAFRSRLRDPDDAEYADLAPRMVELASGMPGFVSFEQFASADGGRVSLIVFETHDDVAAWRRHPEHVEARRLGRERFYAEFELTVCTIVRTYGSRTRGTRDSGP
jgi:heme-degrading monooxygenase HmoA